MCLAIYKPFLEILDEEDLYNGFENNDDGAGFIVSDGQKSIGMKGYMKFSDFMDKFNKFNSAKYACAVHFRWATHGKKNAQNCHPFRITDDYIAVHNGVLPYKSCPEKSDTYYFCKEVLKPLCKRHNIEKKFVQKTIEKLIPYNKIIIMRNDGTSIILNESLGDWKKGSWFSNSSHMRCNYKTTYIGYSNGRVMTPNVITNTSRATVDSNPGFDWDSLYQPTMPDEVSNAKEYDSWEDYYRQMEEEDKQKVKEYIGDKADSGNSDYDSSADDYGFRYREPVKSDKAKTKTHELTDEEYKKLEEYYDNYDPYNGYSND